MNKVFYLGTCNTCKRIIQELKLDALTTIQDIRKDPISPEQLDEMRALAGNYETLFSRRSRQYAARGLKGKQLSEDDFRSLILEEDTFLKRPVVIYEGEIFVGSSKATIESLKDRLRN
jgi:arsenate reductase-like glutaredoxin family protein